MAFWSAAWGLHALSHIIDPHHAAGERPEPCCHGGVPAPLDGRQVVLGDQTGRRLDLAGLDRMADGLAHAPGGGEPGESVAVELPAPLDRAPPELGAQQVREQVVIAVPLAMIVQRRQEQVAALELDQQLGGAAAADGGVADRSGHPLEDRRLDEEVAHGWRQRIERDLLEVVADVARGTAEAGHCTFAVGGVPQGEVREVEPGGPPLGVLVQGRGGAGRQP